YYKPDPPYSEEARKAKYQGIVVVEVIIETDDRVTNVRVVKSPGLGLDEKTIETVRTWRCKAAPGQNGKPVRTSVPIEVRFRLFEFWTTAEDEKGLEATILELSGSQLAT